MVYEYIIIVEHPTFTTYAKANTIQDVKDFLADIGNPAFIPGYTVTVYKRFIVR